MLNRRKSYSHTFMCVAATLLLIFGYSNYVLVLAQGTTNGNKEHPVSTATPAVQTSTVNAKTEQNNSQVATGATPTGSSETHTETGSTKTHAETGSTETPAKTGSTEAHTETGSNETHTETGSNKTHAETGSTETPAKTGSTEAHTETGSTEAPKPAYGPETENSETPSMLSIFLVNDLQYDIFPVHPDSGVRCDTYTEAEKCVGGLPSLKKLMDDHRANLSQSIWLNAGNTLGGDLFRTLKFDAAIRAMQLLQFNATAVGPNVFKYGGGAGRMYLDGLKESTVVSNIDLELQKKSVMLSFGNCSVAVVGYLENTEQDRDIEGVSVKNYTQSVLEEVAKIRSEQKNVSNLITVVIGSSSVKESKILASNETIDFVLFSGGNWSEGNTTGSQFFNESVSRKSANRTAYVASLRVNHSSVADRFLVGRIELPINGCMFTTPNFTVLNYTNIITNNSALELIKSELEALKSQNTSLTVNTKNLTAEKDLCCHSECSVGNLITDAMVAAVSGNCPWCVNVTRIGIFPAVHLRPNATITEGSVTVTSLYDLNDQDAYIYSHLLTGKQLRSMLDVSIKSIGNSNSTDFLHVSRLLQIQYRKDHDNKSEIVSVRTVPGVSSSMQLSEIDVNDTATFYNVSFPRTLLKMDSYKNLLSAKNASFHYVTIVEAVTKYINNTGDLSLPVLGSRFICLDAPPPPQPPPPAQCENHTGTTVAVTLVVAALIVGIIVGIWRWRSIRSHLLPGYVNF